VLGALALAAAQLGDPPFRRLILIGIVASLLLLIGLAGAASFLLAYVVPASWEWATLPVALFGGLAGLILAWLMFPAVSALAAGILAERLARTVERRHYPAAPEARASGAVEAAATTLRLALAGLLLNALALPVYLLVPGVNLVLFLALNGYLVSREYFESAAARHFAPEVVGALRRQRRFALWLGGVLLAALLVLPGLNLFVPYLGLAAMVHLVEQERNRQAGG